MASIKFKLRPSAVLDSEGILHFQITHYRQIKRLSTKLKVFPHEWDEEKQQVIIETDDPDRFRYLNEVKLKLKNIFGRLSKAIMQYTYYPDDMDISEILSNYFRKTSKRRMFSTYAQTEIDEIRESGNKGKADRYATAVRMFMRYREGKDITLEFISRHEIMRFETYLTKRGIIPNTISFYMRILRALYNKAVQEGYCEQNLPFGNVYTGIAKTKKRAIDAKLIKQLKELELDKSLAYSRDLFLFSFYTRGMAFVDIASLKKTDLKNGYLTYKRRKTQTTLTIKVEECTKPIINRYKTKGEYLFPIMNNNIEYTSALRAHNKQLNKISEIMCLDFKLTSYVSRHTWASVARKKGVALQIISEGMGHTSENTTRIYLDSLDRHVIDEANSFIIES